MSNQAFIPATAKSPTTGLLHPGQYVRDTVLTPNKMSVTYAAELIGVGRPALSNFLNANVAVTKRMASRIERAFKVPAQTLLDMQAAYDAAEAKTSGAPANTKEFVPPYLGIKANEIAKWASERIVARSRLSVLLRTLANSTGVGIRKVDFPGNDDAERPGWDGWIEAAEGTPWIPEGLSGWEFGTNKGIKAKADKDFSKSVKAVDKAERDHTTFVFVTPRRWPGKTKWVNDRKAELQWKDVRAYDASDLEQWLEQSIAGQAWFANETDQPSEGVRALDECWSGWANVSDPPLAAELFTPAINGNRRKVLSLLSQQPGEPIVIAADSIEEALAFLAQLFGQAGGKLAAYRDQVLVFDKPGVLPQLARGTQRFIAIATNRDVERELAPLVQSMHTIIVCPRNAANTDPHVRLQPLSYEGFRSALEEMGYERDDIERYSNESGRSPTVLRRRLSTVPAVRTPRWAADDETTAGLIPFLMVGTWNSTNEADQTALGLLANADSYETLEKECQRMARLNDAPVWSVGTYRGVISKIDLLFAIGSCITTVDLKRYFELAKMVLGEDDPKLDLPENERWAASFHGKSREFSSALREGISETLVLLSVHGNHLFQGRLGFNAEAEAARLVQELLTPLTARTLEAQDRDLPTYSEAAPDEFLSILEQDLKAKQPACISLMRPAGTGTFAGCPRTGLLWALEGLAWNPATLSRTVLILARLAEVEIDDNWANKPIGSLESIFRAWMPQTAADHDQRLAAMKLLSEKFPSVAWKVCVNQFDTHHQMGDYSHKPRWRTDSHGFGEPFRTRGPVIAFMREMIDMALRWENHTREMLSDLVERLHDLTDDQQATVWELVRSWANAGASDADKAWVREKIRVTIMSRRGVKRAKSATASALSAAAKDAYQALEPSDIIFKHDWLFRESWVEESADELHDDDLDYSKRDRRIAKQRADALCEVQAARGISGVIELAEMGKAASQIGWSMTTDVLAEKELPDFLLEALPPGHNDASLARKNVVYGALHSIQVEAKRARVLKKVKKRLSQADFVRLLLLAPFCRDTWQMVDQLDEAHRHTYWNDVEPDWRRQEEDELNEAVERLLTVQRPRAAFACIRYDLEKTKLELLLRLMSDIPKDGKDRPGHYQLEHYYVEKAFSLIDKSTDISLEQKAGLEFTYIDALSKPWSRREGFGIPNLEKYIEIRPELFVQAIVWTYKRRDDGVDPTEWKVEPESIQYFATRGHKLLEAIDRIPGHNEIGELETDMLAKWVNTVRDASAELGRLEVADVCLGKLFSRAPEGKDGVWPCEPVRQVMEDIQSKEISDGAHTGLYNARGVHSRGEGGAQERELADKYRAWAQALEYSHPHVASTVLMAMVKTYEYEANHQDIEADVRKRLG